MDKISLMLEITCVDLPSVQPADCPRLGIQEKREVIRDVAWSPGDKIHFQVPVGIEINPEQSSLRYRGSFVQGPSQDPFIYLCWGNRLAGEWKSCRRAKFPLSAFPSELIERAVNGQYTLEVYIHMNSPKGEPVAATLKPDQYQVSLRK